jgi:hypothetical protein
MRDINEEMQKYPFDSELKLLASNFSATLKPMVEAIDKHGFKTRYLSKHKKAAREFCLWSSSKEFHSPSTERLRARIEKYQNWLFTFLDHDGVSWNNTNAEHFIKPFAKFRRTANGRFTAYSIQDYLIILSVAQTCRGRGEDFLDFLLEDNRNRISFISGRSAPKNRTSQKAPFPDPLGPG